jgi:hypothetical protein
MWQLINVNEKKEIDWKIGDVWARIFRDAAHWQVRFSCPAARVFSYDVICTGETVCFKPYLPEVPLIAFLPQKFYLAPETEVCFKIVLLPVIQMEIGRNIKTDIQLFPLKMSFEGIDTVNGEFCLVLPDAPQLLYAGEIEDGRAGASLAGVEAVGPSLRVFTEAIIRNRSKQGYAFDRITIYPETVDIYEKNAHLIGDLVIIDYIETGEFRLQTPAVVPSGYRLLTSRGKDGVGARIFRQSAGFFRDITSMKLT